MSSPSITKLFQTMNRNEVHDSVARANGGETIGTSRVHSVTFPSDLNAIEAQINQSVIDHYNKCYDDIAHERAPARGASTFKVLCDAFKMQVVRRIHANIERFDSLESVPFNVAMIPVTLFCPPPTSKEEREFLKSWEPTGVIGKQMTKLLERYNDKFSFVLKTYLIRTDKAHEPIMPCLVIMAMRK